MDGMPPIVSIVGREATAC